MVIEIFAALAAIVGAFVAFTVLLWRDWLSVPTLPRLTYWQYIKHVYLS